MHKKITYPYRIKTVRFAAGNPAKGIPIANILEWLKIECLLRTPWVWKLYRGKPKYSFPMYKTEYDKDTETVLIPGKKRVRLLGDELHSGLPWTHDVTEYGTEHGWRIVRGAHHALLQVPDSDESNAVVDLRALAKQKPARVQFEDYLLLDDPGYLCLRFDITTPLDALVAELRRRYRKQELLLPKNSKKKDKLSLGRVAPAIWINYFRWYDWHVTKGLSVGLIRNKENKEPGRVPPVTESAITQGIRRARLLIAHVAKKKKWPPPANFLHY